MKFADRTTPPAPSPAQGVYRFKEKIDGCNAWYARGPDGSITDFVIARPGMSEAQIVDDLAAATFGRHPPTLTLIRPLPAAAFWPPAVLAGVARTQLAAKPVPIAPR